MTVTREIRGELRCRAEAAVRLVHLAENGGTPGMGEKSSDLTGKTSRGHARAYLAVGAV